MGILQAPQQLTGSSGVNPNFKYMVSTDNLSTITTAGYLNNIDLAVYPILPSDILMVNYGATSVNSSATFGMFSVSITNGIIKLNQVQLGANIQLPTVTNEVIQALDTQGTLGVIPGVFAGNLMRTDTTNNMGPNAGIIADKASVTTTGGIAVCNHQAGILTTPGLTTAAGSTYVISLSCNQLFGITQCVMLTSWQGGTNTVGNISINATITGTGTATITIYNNSPSAALNGTVIIGYVVF